MSYPIPSREEINQHRKDIARVRAFVNHSRVGGKGFGVKGAMKRIQRFTLKYGNDYGT